MANEIILKEYIHLGIAVDTDAGLIVPVIRDVDKKSVLELAKELKCSRKSPRPQGQRRRSQRRHVHDLESGAIGGAHFTPIVNKPEVAILGLGRGAMKPVVRDGKIEARMMTPIGCRMTIASLTAAAQRASPWTRCGVAGPAKDVVKLNLLFEHGPY